MQQFRRFLAAFACVVVGLASFAISYVALRDVAVAVEAVPPYLGWLVPVVIDGGVICGSAVIWSLSREQDRRPTFPFLFVGALVLVSVVVNVHHAGDHWLAKAIAALPPLILLGTLELVASQGRRMMNEPSSSDPSAPRPADTAPADEVSLPAQRPAPAPAPSALSVPAAAPAPSALSVPAAAPAPDPALVPAPAVEPAPAPVVEAPVPAPTVEPVPAPIVEAPVPAPAVEPVPAPVVEVPVEAPAPARAAAKAAKAPARTRARTDDAPAKPARAPRAPRARASAPDAAAPQAAPEPTEPLEPVRLTTTRSGVTRKAPRVKATPAAAELAPEA